MKRIIKLLLIGIILLIPKSIFALSASPSISCNSSGIAPGGSTSCTIYVIVNSGGLKGIDAKVSVTSGLSISSLTKSSGWQGSISNNRILLYTDSKRTGKVAIASLTVKASSSASSAQTISVTNIGYSDENDNDATGGSTSKTLSILSGNNNLSSLTISNGTLSPGFSAGTTSYSATINANSTVIKATAQDSKAKISGTGTKTIKYGTNKYNVVVTAESGAKKTYVITITRPDNRNKDNTLKSLKVTNTDIKFNKNTTSYTAIVDNNITSVDITAVANDKKATVTGTGKKSLKVGTNTFTVSVKAENESVKNYKIVIKRKNEQGEIVEKKEEKNTKKSENNYLKSIVIDKYDLMFNKNTLEYKIKVDEKVDKVNINYETEDKNAAVSMDKDGSLVLGKNTITITVTAENGSTRKYVLNITRGNYVNNNEKEIIEALKESGNEPVKVRVNSEEELKLIPHSVLEALRSSNKELIYVVSNNEKEEYYVTINKDNNNYYNYQLSFTSKNDSKIKKLTNNNKYLLLVLDGNKNIDINATYKVNIKDKDINDYKELDLYYYDELSNQLVLVEKNIKVEDGYINVNLDNKHDYVLMKANANLTKVPLILYVDIILVLIILVLLVRFIKNRKSA